MKSKSRIERKAKRKTSAALVEVIRDSKKLENWNQVSDIISSPKRKSIIFNLSEIDEMSKDGENIVVPGKVLSQGEISKKIRLVALRFSKMAEEKLLKSKTEFSYIKDEIKKNPQAKNLRILR
ncbi:50S ribosomal protein L18e [Candidatus Pacearchaeota archaeon]|nr:50S ribosomal protein L18e [Candidatus Pacearchaeota archaeon]